MEYKEQLLIGVSHIKLIVHNDVLLMVLFLESAHLNVGYRKEQSLAPFYLLFILMTCQTA